MIAKAKYRNLLINMVLIILSMACTVFVIIESPDKMGLNWLFLLPLAFTIACFMSKRILIFAKNSLGLLLLCSLLILRYLVSPFLIAQSRELVTGLSLTTEAVHYAIIIMIFELFTVVISINFVWKEVQPTREVDMPMPNGAKLSWLGSMIILLISVTVLQRGTLPNVIEHLSFGLNFRFSRTDLKTYDMSAVLTIKTMLFLVLVSWLSGKYHKTRQTFRKGVYFFLAFCLCILNSIIYDANNRATMVMGAMASLTVLISFFGDRVKKYLPIVAVLGSIFVWTLFSYGTLGVKSGESLLGRQGYIGLLSRVAELYSNGISTLAHSYNMYGSITSKMTVSTYISELIKSNNIFTLPGFWVVGDWVRNIPSIQKLFNDTLQPGQAYILPNAGLAMYLGNRDLGILIDIVFHYLTVYSIFSFHKRKEMSKDISYRYLYSYCEMICAFTFMNNIMIAIGLITDLPVLLYVLLSLNNLGHKIKVKGASSLRNLPVGSMEGGGT